MQISFADVFERHFSKEKFQVSRWLQKSDSESWEIQLPKVRIRN